MIHPEVLAMLKEITAILDEHAKQIQLLKEMIDLYHPKEVRKK